eukprot:CAMPEP_0185380724 /NCGR_PEP_ID=MMETSP1364-20130426/50983_1 /TAXON_ID=38817 /ORGANISM="Gephyrocapsa oceanica, Strain RCC1303" /LENGTH=39 /DNA_ID= /DNA_START= /DNA_END= /DNA_ORIENTATION=
MSGSGGAPLACCVLALATHAATRSIASSTKETSAGLEGD